MKKNLTLINLLGILFICSLIMFTLSSCSKESDKTKNEQPAGDTSAATQFTETNEDLLTVDYEYFYKELSPHGEWIEVSAKDLDININSKSSSGIYIENQEFIYAVLGIKTAYAQTGEEVFNLFVWRPSAELVSSEIAKGTMTHEYTPYNNGQWLNTDDGWYFKANNPPEDLTCHYGRWAQDPNLGWVWLPGKVWSPAWVEWRENPEYVAWAPVPPGTYIENNTVNVTTLNENRFTIVEKKHFIEPSVYKYRYQYVENKNKIMIKEMTKTDGVTIKNRTVIDKGPDVASIEKASGKKVEKVKINKTKNKGEEGYKEGEISVFTPDFKTTKEVKKEPVTKPEKLVSYKDAKKITKEEKKELKGEFKEKKKGEKRQSKELKKEKKNLKKVKTHKVKNNKVEKNRNKEKVGKKELNKNKEKKGKK
jgi:hypothetical protein